MQQVAETCYSDTSCALRSITQDSPTSTSEEALAFTAVWGRSRVRDCQIRPTYRTSVQVLDRRSDRSRQSRGFADGPRQDAGDAGLRCGEMMALEWTDVDLAKRQLWVPRSDSKGNVTVPKSGQLRYVPLTTGLAASDGNRRSGGLCARGGASVGCFEVDRGTVDRYRARACGTILVGPVVAFAPDSVRRHLRSADAGQSVRCPLFLENELRSVPRCLRQFSVGWTLLRELSERKPA